MNTSKFHSCCEQIERLLASANVARWAALTAPTDHQARAAHTLAGRLLREAKEKADGT